MTGSKSRQVKESQLWDGFSAIQRSMFYLMNLLGRGSLKRENNSQWVIARSYCLQCEEGNWVRKRENQRGKKEHITKGQKHNAAWIARLSDTGGEQWFEDRAEFLVDVFREERQKIHCQCLVCWSQNNFIAVFCHFSSSFLLQDFKKFFSNFWLSFC